MKKITAVLVLSLFCTLSHAGDQNPGEEHWKDHDTLFKKCQIITKAHKYEQNIIKTKEKDGAPNLSKREACKKKKKEKEPK